MSPFPPTLRRISQFTEEELVVPHEEGNLAKVSMQSGLCLVRQTGKVGDPSCFYPSVEKKLELLAWIPGTVSWTGATLVNERTQKATPHLQRKSSLHPSSAISNAFYGGPFPVKGR